MKVRYCVNNEMFGVLHLHPDENEDETGAPFMLLLEDGEMMARCKKLKKGNVVVVEFDDSGRKVKNLTVEEKP